MAFRLPTSVPQSLPEFWERFREFVRQVEPVVLPNVSVGTTETAVAHGLGEVPAFVAWSTPHCRTIVSQTKRATKQAVYLKSPVACVVDVYVFRMSQLGMGEVPNGGFQLPDWNPTGDHKFSTDATDEAAGGAGYALTKLSSTGNVKPTLDTTSSQRRTRFDVTLPTGFPGFYEEDPEPVGVADPGDSATASHGNHSHAREPTPQITNVYYHDDANALVNPCPSTVSSLSFAFSNDTSETFANYATIVASPGIADWQGGVCNIVLRVKVANIVGTTHQVAVDLNRVSSAGVQVARYCNAVQTWVGPADILTGSIQVLRFQVPVKYLTGAATDRLRMTIYALPGLGGAVNTESLYIETGADGSTVLINDASQIQTLFGSSTGGPLEHSLLTGRSLADQHPWAAVTRPVMGVATLDAGGTLVTVPTTTDRASVAFPTTHIMQGICKTGFVHGQELHLFVTDGTAAVPVAAIHGADLSGSPTFAPLSLETASGVPYQIRLKGPTWLKFWYDADAALWRQAGKPITYVVPT